MHWRHLILFFKTLYKSAFRGTYLSSTYHPIPRNLRIIDYRRLLYFPAPHRAFHSKTPERAKKEKNCYCSLYNTRKILISRKKEWLVVLDDHLSLSWYFWIEKKSIDEIWWENYSKTHISTTAEFPDNFYFCHFLLLDFFAS